MKLHAWSLQQIEKAPLPATSAVICMADTREQLARIADENNVTARLDLIFNDTTEGFGQVRPPTREDARRILDFYRSVKHQPHLVAQCQVGVGRSYAVIAALAKIGGADPREILVRGTHNRKLYKELLREAGIILEAEPLISIAARVKYSPDRLRLLILSMQRQRYENWELIAVTDGPNEGAVQLVAEVNDARIQLIETEQPRGDGDILTGSGGSTLAAVRTFA
jgi:hypothetical protein